MKRRIQNILNNEGFSILEILVASAIAAMILVMISTSYRNVLQAITGVSGYAEFYENINLAINKIDSDISNTFFDRYNKKTAFIGDLNGDNSTLNFITTKHSKFHISGSMIKDSPYSDINEVGYYLKEDTQHSGLFLLIRREQLLYDDEPDQGGRESILLENVVNLKFEYNNWKSWDVRWDTRANKRIVRAVRTTLLVKNYQNKEEKFIFTTFIDKYR